MKKEDVSGLIIYILIFAAAIIFGLTVLQPHFAKSTFDNGFLYALFILGAIAAALLGSAILLEIGHILGAKIGKYNIISVCIFGILFFKENGKNKVKFSSFSGFTGETKIVPKSEKSNPNPYLLMGTLFIALYIVLAVILFYVNLDTSKSINGDMAYFWLTVAVVSGVCLLYNIIPIKLDSINDGYRLAMVSNPKNKEAFNELLRVEYEISQGNENVEIKTFTELTNFTAELNMNKVYVLLDKQEYAQADELLNIVLDNKASVSNQTYLRAIAMKVYINVVHMDYATAEKFINDNITMELRRSISADSSLISIRAYVLIAGLFDNSKSECILVLDKTYRAYKRTPKNRREIEKNMFNESLDKVIELHPKWELEKYKIEL